MCLVRGGELLSKSITYTILYKNTNHQQMHKESFIINRNTLLQVSTLLGHFQGEFTPPKTTQYAVNSTFSLSYKVQH
jgi:hypothetical protein